MKERPTNWPHSLFSVYGIEIEYMIVDSETLDVRPWADRVLRDSNGEVQNEIRFGPVSWCNELAAHVVELKCSEPAPSLQGLAAAFARNIAAVNELLADQGARLLPGGMHPWMDPDRELQLWDQEFSDVYQAYHRIFGCTGHGWANLQSMQINLPFSDDTQFGSLHAAIRTVLPLLGGLAASTPVMDGRLTGRLCNRMEVYRLNSIRIPSVTGQVVPERVFSVGGYYHDLLEPMYRDIAPLDPEGILQEEWLNSRGAIARFDRGSIEIRTMDSQEYPTGDLGVAELVCTAVRALTEERLSSFADQRRLSTRSLAGLLMATIDTAEHTLVDDRNLSLALGLTPRSRSMATLWGDLAERLNQELGLSASAQMVLEHILSHGTLASRLTRACGQNPSREHFRVAWRQMAECLASNSPYQP